MVRRWWAFSFGTSGCAIRAVPRAAATTSVAHQRQNVRLLRAEGAPVVELVYQPDDGGAS